MKNTQKEFSVAFAGDKNAIPGLSVALFSAAQSLDRSYRLDCRVVDCGLTSKGREILQETARKCSIEPKLKFYSLPSSSLKGFSMKGHIPTAAYARYFISDLCADCDQILYLDYDVIVNLDVSQLPMKMDDSVLLRGVVEHQFETAHINRTWPDHGVPLSSNYYNTGVLHINAKRWRDEQVTSALIEATVKHSSKTFFCDQDIINVTLHDRWETLPRQWNWVQFLVEEKPYYEPIYPVIIHTAGKIKPWDFSPERACGIVKIYYRYLAACGCPISELPVHKYSYRLNFLQRRIMDFRTRRWQHKYDKKKS